MFIPVSDTRSGFFSIPDPKVKKAPVPWVKKAPDPGSATLDRKTKQATITSQPVKSKMTANTVSIWVAENLKKKKNPFPKTYFTLN